MKEHTRIPKLILIPSQIESSTRWNLKQNDVMESCVDCNSNLFYIEKVWGIIAEDLNYGILGYKEDRSFRLSEIGLNLYCAECGNFNESHFKWFYPEDKLIMQFDELDDVEKIEVDYCLSQYNQKHSFTPRWKGIVLTNLKEKLDAYVKKYPIKKVKQTKK